MSQCNKGQSSSPQQETQESVLCQEKIVFQDHKAASNSKETFLLNQVNHEKKQSS